MSQPFSVEAAAAALLAARRTRVAIPLPERGPAGPDEAFAVQARVASSLGPAAAWKVGGPGKTGPYTAAPIAASLVRPSPCIWPAGEFLRRGIEVEIAFRIGRDLPAGEPPAADAVRAAIGSVHAAIEIADSRFDTWPVPDPLWALADNQSNGGFVYEPEGRPWAGEPLGRAAVTLTVDGETAFSGEGVNLAGDPFALLVRLAAHAARHGGLAAGTFVTTGSLTGMLFVQPGAEVVAEVAGFGRVALRLPG